MGSLIDAATNCIEAHGEMGPLWYRWGNEDDHWEVWVYPASGKIVGGPHDGKVIVPGYSLDVKELTSVFDELVDVRWQAHRFLQQDQDAPKLSFEGTYQGHSILLMVLSEAPDDEEPGYEVDLSDGRETAITSRWSTTPKARLSSSLYNMRLLRHVPGKPRNRLGRSLKGAAPSFYSIIGDRECLGVRFCQLGGCLCLKQRMDQFHVAEK
jgi:hypothetical protein